MNRSRATPCEGDAGESKSKQREHKPVIRGLVDYSSLMRPSIQ